MSVNAASTPLIITVDRGVAEIRFNRPEQMNALDVTAAEAFRDAIDRLLTDGDVRVILLSGADRAFMAGGDLTHFRNAPDRAAAARALIAPIHEGLLKMVESGIPTISAIQGAAAGAGMSIAALTDLAIAAEDARFSMAYIRIAANPDCGGSWALPRLLGRRKAAELMLLSDTIDAQEALRLGLVNWIVPLEQLHDAARKIADRIAAGSGPAMRRTRGLLDCVPGATLRDQLNAELEGFATGAASADFDEALDAFFSKRAPVFKDA